MNRVEIKPELLRWARERAGKSPTSLARRFPKLGDWESGQSLPTLKQLEGFAKATHTPIGYLFLPKPPVEKVPIPDFRTMGNDRIGHPSPDLLDTIYACQQRQEWYREFARSEAEKPLHFVGSLQLTMTVEKAAAKIAAELGFDVNERVRLTRWEDALRRFVEQAEALGVLVMINGVVGSNVYRKLDPREFRGFALSDDFAPLVFINGADTKSAQMFTLAHELAHIWLGETAVSDSELMQSPTNEIERWCNRVAAELLVPLDILRRDYNKGEELWAAVTRLARKFKVSTLVVLRRIHDAGGLTRDEFWAAYNAELKRLREITAEGGGNFHLTQPVRVSKRFARALIARTLEGQVLYRDAFQMLGFSKAATLHELGRSLGVI